MNTLTKKLALLLAALLMLAAPLGALAVDVGTYAELREAAISGEAIINIVQDLTYDGNGTAAFTGSVTITASGDGYSIAGNGTARLIEVDGDLTISSLTLTDGYAEYDGNDFNSACGGALFVTGDATIENCTFTGNASEIDGGAVSILGDVTINNSTFTGNESGCGGAVNVEGNAQINGSEFTNNYASSVGGAVYVDGNAQINDSVFTGNEAEDQAGALTVLGNAVISDSTFADNKTGASGGAVFMDGNAEINDSVFTNNKAGGNGGALAVFNDIEINNSEFTDNESSSNGGAVYVWYSDATINNSKFTGNEASGDGGAVSVSNGDAQINDSTFTDNEAGYYGGAVSVWNGDATINNSVFTGNKAGEVGGAICLGADYDDEDYSDEDSDEDAEEVTHTANINDSEFYGNSAKDMGGSIYSNIDLTLSGTNYFGGNSANGNGDYKGYGIYMDDGAELTVEGELVEVIQPEPAYASEKENTSVYLYGKIVNCAEWVYLRNDPSADNPPAGTIALGTQVIVLKDGLGADGCWVKIIYNDTVYYVHGQFVALA